MPSPEKLDSAPNTLQADAYLYFMYSMPVFCGGSICLSIVTATFFYQSPSVAINK